MKWSTFKQESRSLFYLFKPQNMAYSNALIGEKSPYLLQHAHNPVEWHPWGDEAFKLAKNHNKLIFLSVGYSTCHWCHVMEKESFENEEVAKIMNKNFVNIKVDREERPDVDKLYMTFVQATTGGGGWPMSVWLTPDLKPIFGGTYFPPEEKGHQIGFKTILERIADKWKHSMAEMTDSSENFMKAIKQSVSSDISAISRAQELRNSQLPDLSKVMEKCFEQYCRRFDPTNGGFSRAPKFPQPVIMDFLFAYHKFHKGNDKGDRALDMISITLKKMSLGGVYDQLGNGFHRYSVDGHWFLPHFEKMLYDQAQLVTAYARTFNETGDAGLGNMAHRIISYLQTDMTNKANGGGGFFSAEDADSLPTKDSQHKKEGAFYVWTWAELEQILSNVPLPAPLTSESLGTSADLFASCYGVKPQGNVDPTYDPHHELEGMNVLALPEELQALADKYGAPRDEFTRWVEGCKAKLLAERNKRPRPGRDDKILACWNGLMISALVHASLYLDNQDYLKLAEQSAKFVKDHMFVDGQLLRTVYYDAKTHKIEHLKKPIAGFVDDYAFVVQALIDLYEVGHDEKWLIWGRELQDTQNDLFWDKESGGYFISPHSDSFLVMRMKEEQDGAEPSGNSISASNLIRLSTLLGQDSYLKMAEKIFEAYSYAIVDYPSAVPRLLSAYRCFASPTSQAIIYGPKEDAEIQKFVKCLYGNVKGIIFIHPGYDGIFKDKDEIKNILGEKRDRPTVYLCENNACSLPIESVLELKDKLNGKI